MSKYVVIDAFPGAISYCDKTLSLLGEHFTKGGKVVKVVHCAKHYGAALLADGRLLLLAPGSSRKHGSAITGDGGVVRDVAAGDAHIVFCMDDGKVFSFGYSNKHGQLGDGTLWEISPLDFFLSRDGDEGDDGLPRLSAPRMISGFGRGSGSGGEEGEIFEGKLLCVPVVAVACGAFHTLLLTAKGNCVYGCGLGVEGQLGGKRCPLLQPSFKSIRLLFGLPVKQIAAAGKHSFVLLQTGKLLAFGDNTCGQLGLGSTHMVSTPTPVAFTAAGNVEKRKVLDSFALKGLRAAFGTVESMYYPLRVERISPELDPGEPVVVSVWCCAARSLVLTSAMEWMSCGLPLSLGCPPRGSEGSQWRMDRHGVLGRWMRQKTEATLFGKMKCSERISALLSDAFPLFREGGAQVEAALGEICVACTARAVALLVPDAAGEAGARVLFLQGGGGGAELVENGRRTPLAPSPHADLLLQDCGDGDDSCEYPLTVAQTIVSSEKFLAVM